MLVTLSLKSILQLIRDEGDVNVDEIYTIVEKVFGKCDSFVCHHSVAYDDDRGWWKDECKIEQGQCWAFYKCPDCGDEWKGE